MLITVVFLQTAMMIEAVRTVGPRRSELMLRALQLAQLHPIVLSDMGIGVMVGDENG
jgi:hypothetical protein